MNMKLIIDDGKFEIDIINYHAGRTVTNNGDEADVSLLIVDLAQNVNIDNYLDYAGTMVSNIKIIRDEIVLYESNRWSIITNVNAFSILDQKDKAINIAQITFQ